MIKKRTGPRKKALEIKKYFNEEHPDYGYLRAVFMHLRKELNVRVKPLPKPAPSAPTEEEVARYYDAVWKSQNMQDMLIIKTLLYTGIRVSELIRLKNSNVDLDKCQIKVVGSNEKNTRIVPFAKSFREVLALHISNTSNHNDSSLFESSRKKQYSDRGIRKILEKYSKCAGIEKNISPNQLRHFLFIWLKKKGISDDLIQPYSGHERLESLRVYSNPSLAESQEAYDENIKNFPV